MRVTSDEERVKLIYIHGAQLDKLCTALWGKIDKIPSEKRLNVMHFLREVGIIVNAAWFYSRASIPTGGHLHNFVRSGDDWPDTFERLL